MEAVLKSVLAPEIKSKKGKNKHRTKNLMSSMSLLESQTKAVVVTLYTSLFPWFCCFTDFSRPRMSLFSVSVFSSCSFLLNVLRLLSYSSPQLLLLLLVVLERDSMSKKLLMREKRNRMRTLIESLTYELRARILKSQGFGIPSSFQGVCLFYELVLEGVRRTLF